MFRNARHYKLCALLLLPALDAWAARYGVVSISPSSLVVSCSLTQNETSRLLRGIPFTFGIACTPGVRPAVSIEPHITAQTALVARLSAAGWMGGDYIQWITFEAARRSISADPAAPAGWRITLSFNSPIYPAVASPVIRNNIVRLPVRHGLLKMSSVSKPALPCSVGVRIEVSSDGMYQVSGRRLRELGVPTHLIPTRLYRCHCRGTEVPIYITNSFHEYLADDDAIVFHGRELRGETSWYTQYSNTNIYWLTWQSGGAGLRIAEISGAQRREQKNFIDITESGRQISAKEFADTVHIEFDNDIRWLGSLSEPANLEDTASDPNADNWYWDVLGDKEISQFAVDIPSPSPSLSQTYLGRIRIGLMGLTNYDSIADDHQFQILLNGYSPGRTAPQYAIWDGQTSYVFESAPFPVSDLVHGRNIITFIRTPNRTDMVALNWIEVEYVKGFVAYDDIARFRNHPGSINQVVQFEITGFSQPEIELWDVEKHRFFTGCEVRTAKAATRTTYTLVFQDSITSNTRYIAQTTTRRLSPSGLVLDTIRECGDFPRGVDYIMITSKTFAPLLEPLKAAHEKRGLKVGIVNIEDVYNRFSHGIRDPESIRTMLRYIFGQHASSPPRFLLFAGDASHDLYKNPSRSGLTVVPTHLRRVPGWGPAADDGYFATFWGEDNFPDIAVGRLPARDATDMEVMVDKTVGYIENLEHGYWKDNMLIAGGREAEFTIHNNELTADIIGHRMNVLRMDADPASPYLKPASTASTTMAGYINAGLFLINFAGHGGGNVWSDNSFFTIGDLRKLHNAQWGLSGRLPIVFSFTCLTGFFESVFYPSLGEEFVRYGNGGAIAFYGAAGYSKRATDINLNRILLDNALNNSFATLGELITTTELLMVVTYGDEVLPTVFQYNLLGDPALPFALAPDTLGLTLQSSTLRGADTLKITGSSLPVRAGKVKVRVQDGVRPWHECITTVDNGSFFYALPVSPSVSTANGVVRAFAWNDSADVCGWATFSKDTILIYDVRIEPPLPAIGDSVTVKCKAAVEAGATGVRIHCLHTVAPAFQDIIDMEQYGAGTDLAYDTASGYWVSVRRLPTAMSGDFNLTWVLAVEFRVAGSRIGKSQLYTFTLAGRPDLTFTNTHPSVTWRGDSLRIDFQILNKGNAATPSAYGLTFFWGDGSNSDTAFHIDAPPLSPGRTADFSHAIADTQGDIRLTGIVNGAGVFQEISMHNNSAASSFSVVYADVQTSTDSLRSQGGGLTLKPADSLRNLLRIFLFKEPIAQATPLPTESVWLALAGESAGAFHVGTRPRRTAADSLVWYFAPDPAAATAGLNKVARAKADSLFASVYAYDSVAARWHSQGGSWAGSSASFMLKSAADGPYALGTLVDRTPPIIQVFVGGREILFLDYAAKGKPFNIIIADPSGIAPASVQALLNNTPLDSALHSDVRAEEDGTTVTMTVYPPPQNRVDSLTIIAEDYAGNTARKVFAYMPGEELSIRFLSCHPNPFSARPLGNDTYKLVRFAFILTDIASNVTLSIYTIAGRKIWTWNGIDLIGYQEVPWNGLDNDGYRIANGTYYAKLVASNSGKKVKKIIRIAKLEGY